MYNCAFGWMDRCMHSYTCVYLTFPDPYITVYFRPSSVPLVMNANWLMSLVFDIPVFLNRSAFRQVSISISWIIIIWTYIY